MRIVQFSEWLKEYQKNKLGSQRKTSQNFFVSITKSSPLHSKLGLDYDSGLEYNARCQVGQLEMVEKEATPEKPRQMGNREKMRRKEENWEVSIIMNTSNIILIIIIMGNREKMRRKEENWEVVIITSITINTSVIIIHIDYHNDHHSHSHGVHPEHILHYDHLKDAFYLNSFNRLASATIRGTRRHNLGLRFAIIQAFNAFVTNPSVSHTRPITRPPHPHPLHPIGQLLQGHQSKRTDIEVLCEIIYAHGER